jgi:hypothetical protein
MSEGLANKLARRAEAVFAHHPFWARKAAPRAGTRKASNFAETSMDRLPRDGQRRTSQATQSQSQRQREFILMFMRHWLAGVLARERPVLFRDLPESFKIGHPLPAYRGRARSPLRAANVERSVLRPKRRARSDAPYLRFVHGCELLAA